MVGYKKKQKIENPQWVGMFIKCRWVGKLTKPDVHNYIGLTCIYKFFFCNIKMLKTKSISLNI